MALNGQFHNACDVILTSQIDIREMVDHDHDHDISSERQKCRHFLIKRDFFHENDVF